MVHCKDGHQIFIEASSCAVFGPDGEVVRLVNTVRDITERKKTEESLRKSEERQKFLLRLSDVLRPLSDPIEILDTVTHTAMDYFGVDRCYYCEIEEDKAIIQMDASRSGLPSVVGVYPLSSLPIHKDLINAGQPFIVPDVKTTDLVDEELRQLCIQLEVISYLDVPVIKGAKPVGILCIVQGSPRNWTDSEADLAIDISERTWAAVERANAEAELKNARDNLDEKIAKRTKELSEERQRLLDVLETLPFNICLLSPDYKIPFSNRAFRERLGESNGRLCYDFIFGLEKPCENCQSLRPLETGQSHNWLFNTPDGSIIDVYDFPFTDTNGKSMILEVSMDITEKRKIEAELAGLDRLNLIGEMVAGIGHEIRNPMTTVKGFLQLLSNKMQYQDDYEVQELMVSELDRANEIITEYLSLARNKPVYLKSRALNNIIKSLSPLIHSDAIKSDKEVILDLDDIPEILLDEKEIRQLILNLVRNGLEAMNCGGMLCIRTHSSTNEVVLEIEDTGGGIPAEVIDKLGQPFVTTKDNGTGLGLSVCYSICERHKATMNFKTSTEGTSFTIRFPIFRV